MSRNVYVISGAPGSGKSTYVRSRRSGNDLVVDLDAIAQAIRGDGKAYGDNSAILGALLSVRDTLYRHIRSGTGKWENAWVITTDHRAVDLAAELGGKLIRMEASREECKRRVREDPQREDKALFEGLIDKWYDGEAREQLAAFWRMRQSWERRSRTS